MSSRDEFAVWFIKRIGDYGRDMQINFDNPEVKLMLEAWEASRASLMVELPRRKQNDPYCYDQGVNALADGFNQALEICADSLKSQGIKVKL